MLEVKKKNVRRTRSEKCIHVTEHCSGLTSQTHTDDYAVV